MTSSTLEFTTVQRIELPHKYITAQMAIDALTEVVTEAGRDTQAPKCTYATCEYPNNETFVGEKRQEPVEGTYKAYCIVGRCLAKWGVSPEVLYHLDMHGTLVKGGSANVATWDYINSELVASGMQFSPGAVEILSTAQQVQDHRYYIDENVPHADPDTTWGHALDVAKARFDVLKAVGVH